MGVAFASITDHLTSGVSKIVPFAVLNAIATRLNAALRPSTLLKNSQVPDVFSRKRGTNENRI